MDNNSAVHDESDNLLHESDLPNDMDRKEKFKMTIGKSRKDGQDPIPKDQAQNTVSMDAAATAAILQAATRGIKNPNLEFFSKTSSGSGQGLGSDGGYLSSSGTGSLYSSQPQGLVENPNLTAKARASAPVAKAIAEKIAIATAGEADSSEAHMTKEQKIKAERLKRAKMFAAMLKSGVGASELPRALSVEPPGSGLSGSDAETGNIVVKEREGSSVPFDVENSDKSQNSEEKLSVDNSDKSQKSEEKLTDDNNDRRSKRKYRSRSSRHEEEEEEKKEDDQEDKRRHKRSGKRHRSSHHSRERHKHKRRHSSSKDRHSYRVVKHDSSSDDEHQRSRRRHKSDSSSDDEHLKRRHSRRSHKHYSSSDDERRHRSRSVKRESRSHGERETELEEGEIHMKLEKSAVSGEVGRGSREASAGLSNARASSQSPEVTDVSDELRAKIRAMLMANW